MMALGVTVKLFDQMSGGMGRIVQQVDGLRGKLQKLSDQASAIGRGALGTGLIAGGTLAKPIAAFAALEDASTRLKSAMMDKNGMTGAFEQVNTLAVKLGDRLPGTTADFLNMMATLKKFGITDQSILTGVGEATAYMAVLLKQTPEQAAEFAAKLKEATGVADADMLKFMDTIQRVYHQGVSATEMMYAFARSAGALKAVKLQGLEASREMSALYAILIKTGMSGETVGTGMGAILNGLQDTKKIAEVNAVLKAQKGLTLEFTDKKGNFLGVQNMMTQLDKLKELEPGQLNKVLKHLFGGGQDMQMVSTLISNGTDGFRKMTADMEKQADLQRRIEAVLRTLSNLWEAATGTFTNLLASLGEAVGEDLKMLTEWFGKLSESVKGFVQANPTLAKWLGRIALGFAGLMIAGGSLLILVGLAGKAAAAFMALGPVVLFGVGAFAKLMTVMSAVGAFMLANPITIAIALLAAAAGLIYENWGPIKEFFVGLWEGIKTTVGNAVEWIGAKLRSISDMLPEWVTKYTLPGAAIKLAGDALGPARPNAVTPGGAKANVGGKVVVEVKDPGGMVTGISARSDNRDVPLSLDNGLAMVAP
jgi:TP901 family phage tail tape measure protein